MILTPRLLSECVPLMQVNGTKYTMKENIVYPDCWCHIIDLKGKNLLVTYQLSIPFYVVQTSRFHIEAILKAWYTGHGPLRWDNVVSCLQNFCAGSTLPDPNDENHHRAVLWFPCAGLISLRALLHCVWLLRMLQIISTFFVFGTGMHSWGRLLLEMTLSQ